MDTNSLHSQIVEFINSHNLGVISTVALGGSQPESALVAFCNDDKLNLVIGTSNQSRKYVNLKSNPKIAFVIGWDSKRGSVQYEGIAQEIDQGEEDRYTQMLIERNEASGKFLGLEDQRYFLITPTWVRFTNRSGGEQEVNELTF